MSNWIVVISLYALGMGLLTLLGGLGAAGDAFRRWGESHSRRERCATCSS